MIQMNAVIDGGRLFSAKMAEARGDKVGSGELVIAGVSVTSLLVRSLVRLVTTLVGEPISSVTTLLYYSDLLPQNLLLQRLVRHELLDQENYLFHFLVNFLRCFW
ncbi:hypothetical protein RHGRI_000765 [Rhododendron griersonianum]|uniref:Uncharacterized protein n=1 Tax=Rhododendron griersonianum TaxID=479676 RepID=A0AAV6LL47_9ERIC|nr:hypothetical protein RHGRI_000765 [Rhododendron griersonianum]